MKVLITGATGLIGSELVSHCHRKGYDVNYLTTSKEKIVSEPHYKGFYWNPDKKEIDTDCFNGVSVIINLAGASISKRWTSSYKKVIIESRINSLQTLYQAVNKLPNHSIEAMISASAIGIYPDSTTNYYSEDDLGIDDSFLGEVVELWEKEADTFKPLLPNVAKIRIGLVMSRDGGALPEMAKPIKNYVGAAFGSGEQWQSWIHISDLARIFLFVAENNLNGIFNGVGPNPVTNNKLVKEIAKVLNRPLLLPNIPEFMMKLILGEMSYILFASQRVSSKKIEEEGFVFKFQNVCGALEAIYNKAEDNERIASDLNKEYIS
ncbi:TIGR01777 family oxidoreductase [Maribacter aestuarii]|uniref:TIGR01777 family oxidoreductase n=1 Tax=Maribacter aestuarii TaxID=1130723 RepID=UPI00248AA9E8|nr:TIGR01777 family oxidoreductase [Maribacter aestuarii]